MKHSPLAHLRAALDDLQARNLLRTPPAPLPAGAASFCTNDYLGLASTQAGLAASGAGASRLIAGEREVHARLERTVAGWLGLPAALLFSSGYAANVGTLGALARTGDLIVSDALNHASLIDGARLSGAHIVVTKHTDLNEVRGALARRGDRRAWVVTESYFSMDADGPDLRALREICDASDAALFVDEAHALGVFGPDGSGLCAEAGVQADVLVGTFGKAFGVSGAFVAGSETLRSWLWNRARSFVFSTGVSPVLALAALTNFERARREPQLRSRVLENAKRLRAGLRELGLAPLGEGPIVPWLVGAPEEAERVAVAIRARGHHVVAVRPPTVPHGTSRLRLVVTASHTHDQIDSLLEAVAAVLR